MTFARNGSTKPLNANQNKRLSEIQQSEWRKAVLAYKKLNGLTEDNYPGYSLPGDWMNDGTAQYIWDRWNGSGFATDEEYAQDQLQVGVGGYPVSRYGIHSVSEDLAYYEMNNMEDAKSILNNLIKTYKKSENFYKTTLSGCIFEKVNNSLIISREI